MPDAFGLLGGAPWADPGYVAQGLEPCAAGLSGRQRIKAAVEDSNVVGGSYSGLALADDGQTAHTQLGVIHGIAVRPDRRRRGAATALRTTCEDYLAEEGSRSSPVAGRLNRGYPGPVRPGSPFPPVVEGEAGAHPPGVRLRLRDARADCCPAPASRWAAVIVTGYDAVGGCTTAEPENPPHPGSPRRGRVSARRWPTAGRRGPGRSSRPRR
ncbi:GNAT family N-acetyltransferase [Streptomyces murinus]|uniref:GNAT family N-acetyltransferase n=1 Tax=Streptomyces murinus TaxID=33900 RepID=UPI0038019E3F